MDLSETIVAAMIGALATLATAIFQLFLTFRSAAKENSKPKKGRGVRSLVAILAIVLAAAVGGFALSELRSERQRMATEAVQQRLTDQLQALAASTARLEQLRDGPGGLEGAIMLAARRAGVPGRAESIVQVGACPSQPPAFGSDPIQCDEGNATRLALCASVPAQAGVLEVQLYARPADSRRAWDESRVAIDQDVGGARFVDRAYEMAQDEDSKAVCANFSQWNSERAHLARIVVLYALGEARPAVTTPGTSEPGLAAGTGSGALSNPATAKTLTPGLTHGAKQAAAATNP